MRLYEEPETAASYQCSDPECTETAFSAYAYEEGYEAEWYCWKHANEAGYCPACGDFWGGVERFDFDNPSGMCENCKDEIDDDEYGWQEYPAAWYDPKSGLDQLEPPETPRYIDISDTGEVQP